MELLQDLNEAQKKAVTHTGGPLLIVAGAGTGKTTVITRRIAWFIAERHAKPEEILALTFTDKAASEMEERVDRVLPYGYVNLWVSTFHAFGERILRDYALEAGLPSDFRVLTGAQQWMLVRNNIERFNLDYYRPLGNPTKFIHALLQHFSRAKDELVTPAEYLKYVQELQLDKDLDQEEASRLKEVAEAYHVYQTLLLEKGAFDFGDLINHTLALIKTRPRVLEELRKRFKYILVDEFQDTNVAQYELVKLLASPANNLTVVGDDDQSIYKFRGASISNILQFTEEYSGCRKVFLLSNYRSYQNILDTAYNFIQANNPYRLEVTLSEKGDGVSKKLVAVRGGTAEIVELSFTTAYDEAEGVAKKISALHAKADMNWSDFAILTRANSSAQIFLQALRRHGIPFEYVANRGLYRESVILDIISYLKLLDNYHESEALYRVLTSEYFALPHEDLVILSQYSGRKALSLYAALGASDRPQITEKGAAVIGNLLEILRKHTALARTKSASEIYVAIVHDLGFEERVSHPALVREAQYLAAFYSRIRRFELDSDERTLTAFLKYLALEYESGDEGELPEDLEEGPDTVKVITVHAAKGLEWRYVFIPHLIDRRFPSAERREPIELPAALIKETLPEGDVHLQEERRLFYVAMTRAKDGLYFTRAEDYFGKTTRKPSRFLYELGFIKEKAGKAVKADIIARPVQPAHVRAPRYPIPESFSFSAVSAFRKCPLEYKFRYLLKLPGPGSAQLSFGVSIHKTLELFLKSWQERIHSVQGDLFGNTRSGSPPVPTLDELMAIYERAWIDDWFESQNQKLEYRATRGPAQLKNFYAHFSAHLPTPKYLESWFKIAMGPYKFVGKIDRIDANSDGATIIDYKTGETARKDLAKVDKDQLIIYQIAAQEFLREKVAAASYWYLGPNEFTEPFVATAGLIDKIKKEYVEQIDEIVATIKGDTFVQAHEDAGQHTCAYKYLL